MTTSHNNGLKTVALFGGLWAVLLWLNILAVRKQSVKEIVEEHWDALREAWNAKYPENPVSGVGEEDDDERANN